MTLYALIAWCVAPQSVILAAGLFAIWREARLTRQNNLFYPKRRAEKKRVL